MSTILIYLYVITAQGDFVIIIGFVLVAIKLSCTDNIIVLFILLFTEVCLFVVEYVCIFAIRDKYAKFLIVASLMFFFSSL